MDSNRWVNRNSVNPGVQVEKLRERRLRIVRSGRITEESSNGELAVFDREAMAWLTNQTERNTNRKNSLGVSGIDLVRAWDG
jgi:hypothetical protein